LHAASSENHPYSVITGVTGFNPNDSPGPVLVTPRQEFVVLINVVIYVLQVWEELVSMLVVFQRNLCTKLLY